MREEEIVITLHKNYYEIDVSFKFYNDGPDEKILIGFPVVLDGVFSDENIEEAQSAFLRSYVNGKLLSPDQYTIKDERKERGGGYVTYTRWFLREADFKGKSYTESRVVYKTPYGNRRAAGYTYGTGRTWKGPIGKMTIIVDHTDDVIFGGIVMMDSFDDYDSKRALNNPSRGKFLFSWEANGRYKYVLENVNPKTKSDEIDIYTSCFHSGLYGEYDGQFECAEYSMFRCPLDYVDKYRATSWHWDATLLYKDSTDIMLFTKNQIRLFINFFFAAHGYDFKNKLYKDYFTKQLREENWGLWGGPGREYKVNPKFKEKDFNDIERKNIDYLLKLEKMIPNKDSTETMDKPGIVTAAPETPAVPPPDVSSNPDSIAMVLVEGGTFMMGCTPEQDCSDSDDGRPAHKVTVSSFYIGKYEVTQGLWKSVMGGNSPLLTGDDRLPVGDVKFNDVEAFIRKLNAKTGKKYRLPTEAEWEYSARGGNKSKGYKYSGGISRTNVAWYFSNSDYKTHLVGTKRANELGIHDMSGNVYEWVSDWYGKYSSEAQTNPTGPVTGSYHVIRGGSWDDSTNRSRVAYREYYKPGSHQTFNRELGFRLALDP
jgi:formylglycine-generating enzyme required for sulfatase activity